jgi:hypothetical protein
MERIFLVESKSFSISVLEGASTVRVEEKRKNFFGAIILSTQCSDWLASTLETLLVLRGGSLWVGWSERFHSNPRGLQRMGLA